MSFFSCVAAELNRIGESITVTTESGSRRAKGILQPLLYKNKMYLGGKQLPDGYFDTGHYLLICPGDVELPILGTAFFESESGKYILKRSEAVSLNSHKLYIWAVLSPYIEPSKEDYSEA